MLKPIKKSTGEGSSARTPASSVKTVGIASIIRIVIALVIIIPVGYYLLTYGYRKEARASTCNAVRRQLLSLVELYNMSKSGDAVMKKLDFDKLAEAKLLKDNLVCPEGGKFSEEGDLSAGSLIKCSKHGNL